MSLFQPPSGCCRGPDTCAVRLVRPKTDLSRLRPLKSAVTARTYLVGLPPNVVTNAQRTCTHTHLSPTQKKSAQWLPTVTSGRSFSVCTGARQHMAAPTAVSYRIHWEQGPAKTSHAAEHLVTFRSLAPAYMPSQPKFKFSCASLSGKHRCRPEGASSSMKRKLLVCCGAFVSQLCSTRCETSSYTREHQI